MAQRKVGSQGNQVRVTMSLHKDRDDDIRKRLSKEGDVSAYLRSLVRADMGAEQNEQDRLDDQSKGRS